MLQDQRVGDDKHQRNRELACVQQCVARINMKEGRHKRLRLFKKRKVAMPVLACKRTDVTIDKHRCDKGIDRRNSRRLCGRKDRPCQARNTVDTHHDDDNQKQTPEGIAKAASHFTPAEPFALGHVADARHDIDRDH